MLLNDLYQALDPVALSLGPLVIRWYSLAYLMGFLSCGFLMVRMARHWKLELSVDDVLSIVIAVVFGVILGGRLFYIVFYNLPYYLEHPLSMLMLSEGGMSFHGGLVGALVAGVLSCKTMKLNPWTIADLACIGTPLGLFFGRLANFVNGELWGKPTESMWGVLFETGGGVYRHPSQLYEALLEGLVMFVVLYTLARKVPARPQGTFLGLFLTLYGVFRIAVEFVREPDVQLGYLFGLITMGQLLSIALIVAGVVVLIWSRRTQFPQLVRS